MRDPRNAFRPYVVKETQAARERLAAAHFGIEAVRTLISEAAMRGEGAIRLPLGQTIAELRDTDPARELIAWCSKEGLRVEWVEIAVQRPNGLKLRTAELVVSWVEEVHA